MNQSINLAKQKFKQAWQKIFYSLASLGGVSSKNNIKIFHDGDEVFSSIFEAIDNAKRSIWVEVYILSNDSLGKKFQQKLIAAKKRNVHIEILYDGAGSRNLTKKFLQTFIDENIAIHVFNPIWPWRRKGPLLFRNHRKIIIIDEKIAFVGGMNIAKEYGGKTLGTDFYRDSMAKIEGPAVVDILEIASESKAENENFVNKVLNTKKNITKILRIFLYGLLGHRSFLRRAGKKNAVVVQVLRSNQRRNLAHIQKSMEKVLKGAVNYCYFVSPYFLPYQKLASAMIQAANRGVDVRILTAGISDVALMKYASEHIYKKFLLAGVRIYEMEQKTLHAKYATIDGIYGSIGSFNLDHWSARRNLEVNVSFINERLSLQLKEQFAQDLNVSKEILRKNFQKRGIIRKICCFLAYLLMKL